MSGIRYDVVIIGGGIVGTATGMALTDRDVGSVLLLEAEDSVASHQSGNNSGVIHSGLYYQPGSLKARNCVAGRDAMYRFCEEHDIPYERCGKVVVALDDSEIPALNELERRGKANGLEGLRRLEGDELDEYEPYVAGVAGLYVPVSGITDYGQVTQAFADIIRQQGGEIRLGTRVISCTKTAQGFVLGTNQGDVRCKNLINCAGLYSDRVARMCGLEPDLHIVPFRGEYYELVPESRHLVKGLIYPVPDLNLPFLGVHYTKEVDGGVKAGPNAVLAFKREGYGWGDVSLVDMWDYLTYRGFWNMAAKFWQVGIHEMYRSLVKRSFVNALRGLIPELEMDDVRRNGSGVRAQALDPDGSLVDDFRIMEAEGMIHVLNAPSPAATASMAIGRTIAEKAVDLFQEVE